MTKKTKDELRAVMRHLAEPLTPEDKRYYADFYDCHVSTVSNYEKACSPLLKDETND